MSLAEQVTYSEYWNEIASLAKQISKEAREESRDIIEVLDETIDGHQWVIYTSFNFDVLRHCSDHDVIFENSSDASNQDGMFWGRAAYFAMHRDICEHSDFECEWEE